MNSYSQLKPFCERLGCVCLLNEPMKEHTSFKIGGPADHFIYIKTPLQAIAILKKLQEMCMNATIVGKGSNLLVPDSGIRGVVLSMDEASAQPVIADDTIVICPAGANLSKLCAFALQNNLTGLEFAWGIPASVGGAVYMNAGAYGGEIKDVLVAAEFVDRHGELKTLDVAELGYGYRRSWFMKQQGGLITSCIFQLKKGDEKIIRAKMDEYMRARKEKQPLEYPSAGSTFKRPPGAYAGQLIEQCGLKGHQIGGAMVSKKHAGFIINYENATYEDVKLLIAEVRNQVQNRTGFALACEIRML